MANNEVKVKITTDSSEATAGINKFKAGLQDFESSQKGLVSSIKDHWLGATAAITASIVAVNKAWDLAKQGADFREQQGVLDNLARKYKTTADSIVADMKRAADNQVAKADLMKTALGGIAKGLKPDQLTELTKAAKILGDTVGEDVTTALNNMSEALESGRMRGLKKYAGTTIELKDSFGDLTDQLTATEKAQKAYNDIVILASELQQQQTEAVDGAADKFEQMEAAAADAKLMLSGMFADVTVRTLAAIDKITDYLVLLNKLKHGDFSPVLPSPKSSGANLTPKTVGSADMDSAFYAEFDNALLKKQAQGKKNAEDAKKAAENAAKEALRLAEQWKETKLELEAKIEGGGLSDFKKALIANQLEADKLKEKYKSIKGAKELIEQGQAAADLDAGKKAEEKALDAFEKRVNEQMALDKKVWEQREKDAKDASEALEKYNNLMFDEATYNIDPYKEANNRILDAEREKYEKIEEWGKAAGKSFEEIENAKLKVHENTIEKQKELEKDLYQYRMQTLGDSFGQLKSAFSEMASIYEEGSKSAKGWEEAAKAMEIAQKAVAVVQAVVAIATQGEGDPYTAFARIAAMTAAMTSLLATIGESVGGGGSSSAAHLPASTVLGAEDGTQSESVSKSFELLSDIYDIENTKLTNIYNELRDLNNNITGLVSSIVRTGGVSSDIYSGIKLPSYSSISDYSGKQISQLVAAASADPFTAMTHQILEKISGGTFAKNATKLINSIFGGSVETKLKESGISLGNTNIADILAHGADARSYAYIKKTKDGGWFGSDKTSYSYKYQALDSEVSAMFDKVFQGMGQSLVYFAENLGTSVNDVLNYTLEKTKLDLKDMTADEMNEAISGYISSVSDNAVSALFGDIIGQYQQLNEGLMETATRLIVDKEIVASVLDDTGKAFKGTVPQMIAFSEQLIDIAGGLEELTDAAQQYIDKFYSDAEKFASTKDSIRDVAGILPRTREDYRKLVESIDLTNEVGKQAYYTLMALAGTADAYYSHLEDLANQRAGMEIQLLEAQGKTAEALAASRKRELEAMDESLRPLQELIWLTQDLGTSLETVTTTVTTEINALISTSSSAASEARRMAEQYKNMIETLTEAQISIFGGGKAGAQTRLSDIYSKAMSGDITAMGKMPDAVNTLLTESLAVAKTSLDYRRDQAQAYIALENAKKVAQYQVNWQEYSATLLETQTRVLEEMRDILSQPDPNLDELKKHAELLGAIGTLLQTQNAVTLTGNATQDVIKNLNSLNTSYTEEMLAELVNGGTSQTDRLLSILSSSQTVVTLLGKLLSVFEANKQDVALKEIEMARAEYTSATGNVTDAMAAYNNAVSATAEARQKMQLEQSQYYNANQAAATAAQIYANQPTAANKAAMQSYLSAADTEYAQYAAAQANYKALLAQQQAASAIYTESKATVTELKGVVNALIVAYNKQYPSETPIPTFAAGGSFTGGWRVVGEDGAELEYTGPSSIVSNKDSKKLLDNSGTIAELKALRQDVQILSSILKTQTKKTADILDKFDRLGLPTTRAA